MLNLSNAAKMAALAGAMGIAIAAATITPASADYVTTRCDRDGDRCFPVICDSDGDSCRLFYSDRDRYGRIDRQHWICDEDGDNCRWRSGDYDRDDCRWRSGDYDRDDWRHHDCDDD